MFVKEEKKNTLKKMVSLPRGWQSPSSPGLRAVGTKRVLSTERKGQRLSNTESASLGSINQKGHIYAKVSPKSIQFLRIDGLILRCSADCKHLT